MSDKKPFPTHIANYNSLIAGDIEPDDLPLNTHSIIVQALTKADSEYQQLTAKVMKEEPIGPVVSTYRDAAGTLKAEADFTNASPIGTAVNERDALKKDNAALRNQLIQDSKAYHELQADNERLREAVERKDKLIEEISAIADAGNDTFDEMREDRASIMKLLNS